MPVFAEEWLVFPERYAGHLTLSLGALALGILISAPLGVFAARSERLAGPALGAASVVQTIPGLALLALMVPLMGGRIGFWPAFAALTLYSILPILRNTIVGLRGVDADVREAALAVGMTARQRVRDVDLPLAAPVIVAGVRTAAVWVVGAATLSTPVGAQSLGNYIFQGLQTRNWGAVLFGCLISAALALALDQVIALFERAAKTRRRALLYGGLAGLALIIAPALTVLSGAQSAGARGVAVAPGAVTPLEGRTIVVGAKGFTEQYVLADLIRRVLEAEGARVELRDGLGSTVQFDAVASDEIHVSIDYSGTVWATVMKREEPAPRAVMFAEMSAWLLAEHDILAFARLGFENAYAFAVTQETAAERSLDEIGQLAGSGLSIASDPEFFGRPEWTRTRDAYGLQDLSTRGMDSAFMYDAVKNGEVDIITAYTTDGRIDAFDLALLDDPFAVLPPYDAFILLSPQASQDVALLNALEPLRGALTSEAMRRANAIVDLERRPVGEAGASLYELVNAR
ncbi:MAG: ABC transporter permease/substrate-binding protein [Pseudomonadota bacterium]